MIFDDSETFCWFLEILSYSFPFVFLDASKTAHPFRRRVSSTNWLTPTAGHTVWKWPSIVVMAHLVGHIALPRVESFFPNNYEKDHKRKLWPTIIFYLPLRQTVWAPLRTCWDESISLNLVSVCNEFAPMSAIIIKYPTLTRRKKLWSRRYENTLAPHCLCCLLQAGVMNMAREKEKHLMTINKSLIHSVRWKDTIESEY